MDQINYGTYIMPAQAGLFVHQDYVPEKVTQIKHKIPISKQYVSWGFGD